MTNIIKRLGLRQERRKEWSKSTVQAEYGSRISDRTEAEAVKD